MKIGVFDSGVGGLSVARAVEKALPQHQVIFVNDTQHVPYGNRSKEELYSLVQPILNKLSVECEVIVLACNTVSTLLAEDLQRDLPVPLIPVEPMLEAAAAETKSGIICVCATPATLASSRYLELRQKYASGISVIEPDCSGWAKMIETDRIDHHIIREQISDACAQSADVIVLACTHYHWIEQEIKLLARGRATVIQPEADVVRRLKALLIKKPLKAQQLAG